MRPECVCQGKCPKIPLIKIRANETGGYPWRGKTLPGATCRIPSFSKQEKTLWIGRSWLRRLFAVRGNAPT